MLDVAAIVLCAVAVFAQWRVGDFTATPARTWLIRAILAVLGERDYTEKIEGRFRPTALGKLVNSLLQKGFNDIINEGYTAGLEEQLDEIEEGKLDWKRALREFDKQFTKDLKSAGKELPNVKREGVPTGEVCPTCGAPLVLRFGRYGSFLAASLPPMWRTTDREVVLAALKRLAP